MGNLDVKDHHIESPKGPELSRRDFFRQCLEIATGVSAILMTEKLADAEKLKPIKIEKTGTDVDFDTAHTKAYKDFIQAVIEKIRSGNFTMSNFKTNIGKNGPEYFVTYGITLNRAESIKTSHKVVEIKGTIRPGSTLQSAKKSVDEENTFKWYREIKDGLDWIARMLKLTKSRGGSRIWEENASDSFQEGNRWWYHEAKMIKGN